jgi:hypothetical protein
METTERRRLGFVQLKSGWLTCGRFDLVVGVVVVGVVEGQQEGNSGMNTVATDHDIVL